MIGELVRARYEITEALASTPFFESFVAKDRVRGVEVCVRFVKKPFADEPDFVMMLAKVVEQVKVMDHHGVARVYEIDDHDGQIFIVCEYIQGGALSDRIKRLAPFSPSVACEIAISIGEALEHGTLNGIIHGDLSSDHVIMTLEGRVAVVDFGMWQCYNTSESGGGIVLSRMAPYLAPEIIEGEMPSYQSDVYALGVILFELLTGHRPFHGQTPASILAKHTTQEVPSLRTYNPSIPLVLDAIVSKALAKDKSERYMTPSALLSDLRQLLDALRFGKRLSWPLPERVDEQAVIPIVKTYNEKKKEQRLGTAVHAATYNARTAPKEKSAPQKKQKIAKLSEAVPDDVPIWLRAIVWIAGGFFAAAIVGWILFNMSQKPTVEIPNLLGMRISQAREQAKLLKLELVEKGQEFSDQYPEPNVITAMDPAPGTPVKEGSVVQVKLSLGSRLVSMPDLRGLTLTEARRRLTDMDLKLDPTVRREQSRTIADGLVIRTDPQPTDRVERGTIVTLYVSSGAQRPEQPSRPAEEMLANTWSLRFRVKSSEEPVLVRVEMADARGVEQVVFEDTKPGDSEVVLENVEGVGRTATFRIFFNGFLDRTIVLRGSEG